MSASGGACEQWCWWRRHYCSRRKRRSKRRSLLPTPLRHSTIRRRRARRKTRRLIRTNSQGTAASDFPLARSQSSRGRNHSCHTGSQSRRRRIRRLTSRCTSPRRRGAEGPYLASTCYVPTGRHSSRWRGIRPVSLHWLRRRPRQLGFAPSRSPARRASPPAVAPERPRDRRRWGSTYKNQSTRCRYMSN